MGNARGGRGAVGTAWVWAGHGRAGAGAQERCNLSPFTDPVHLSIHVSSQDACIGGEPDADAARRFRIGGSYKKKKHKKIESAPKLSEKRYTMILWERK